MNLEFVDFC